MTTIENIIIILVFITYRVKLSKDQKHGSVYGRLIWRGLTKEKDEKIGAPLKKEWSLLQLPDYKKFNAKPDDFIPLFPPREIRLVEIAEENAKQQVEANNTQ